MTTRVLIGSMMLSLGFIALALLNILEVTPFKLVVVYSNSMQPTFQAGDIVIIKKNKPVHKGNVILFEYKNHLILHRVVDFKDKMLITKGDANPTYDKARIKPSWVKGVMIGVIPWLGRLSLVKGWFWYGFWGVSLMILGSLIFSYEKD